VPRPPCFFFLSFSPFSLGAPAARLSGRRLNGHPFTSYTNQRRRRNRLSSSPFSFPFLFSLLSHPMQSGPGSSKSHSSCFILSFLFFLLSSSPSFPSALRNQSKYQTTSLQQSRDVNEGTAWPPYSFFPSPFFLPCSPKT